MFGYLLSSLPLSFLSTTHKTPTAECTQFRCVRCSKADASLVFGCNCIRRRHNYRSWFHSCLYGEAAHGEVSLLLLLLGCLSVLLLGTELAADGASALDTKVRGDELLLAEERAQSSLLCLVVYGENASDGLADHFDLGKFGGSATSYLGYTELGKLVLEFLKLLKKLCLVLGAKLVDFDLGLHIT